MTVEEKFELLTPENKARVIAKIEELLSQNKQTEKK